MHPREVLNEIKWRYSKSLDGVEIWYVHRGAKNDTMVVEGSTVRNIGRGYLELADGLIPYHRIFRIVFNGKVIFEREHERDRDIE